MLVIIEAGSWDSLYYSLCFYICVFEIFQKNRLFSLFIYLNIYSFIYKAGVSEECDMVWRAVERARLFYV